MTDHDRKPDPVGLGNPHEPPASVRRKPALRRGRSLNGAAVALVLVVLGVLAFALLGGPGPEREPQVQAQAPAQSDHRMTTGSIEREAQPGEQAIPPLDLNDPAEPVQPAPAN
ncbi:hypothetical protein [Mesorhizobium xinjiangense]|uniref:hypothetical protein n=1 Tax=Mesorhizobium xinjiangense TaxID=2678685 RepID=UPI0012EE59D8|nr:hypothetical protein [Mesorhizobium xinjiangense]